MSNRAQGALRKGTNTFIARKEGKHNVGIRSRKSEEFRFDVSYHFYYVALSRGLQYLLDPKKYFRFEADPSVYWTMLHWQNN